MEEGSENMNERTGLACERGYRMVSGMELCPMCGRQPLEQECPRPAAAGGDAMIGPPENASDSEKRELIRGVPIPNGFAKDLDEAFRVAWGYWWARRARDSQQLALIADAWPATQVRPGSWAFCPDLKVDAMVEREGPLDAFSDFPAEAARENAKWHGRN